MTTSSPTDSTTDSPTHTPTDGSHSRPRIEGDREREVLHAALEVLAEVGYDRLTMDAVASAARAGKATLYRRWAGKQALVIDAICSQHAPREVPDTGSLRGDLIANYCGLGGFGDTRGIAVLGAVITAMSRDGDFAAAYRREVIDPKMAAARVIFDRAVSRGEITADVDIDLLAPALPGIVLHRLFLLGEDPTVDLVTSVVDHVIVPAATRGAVPTGD
jgi:AcrR family transcriptional regulator